MPSDPTPTRQPPAALVKATTPLARRLAGRRWFPLWAVVRHRGRRSGREYAIPVAVLVTPDTFVIGLPWGPGTNWVRNVLAAGECGIRWAGREYWVDRPQLVEPDVAMRAARGAERAILRRMGLRSFLQLHR